MARKRVERTGRFAAEEKATGQEATACVATEGDPKPAVGMERGVEGGEVVKAPRPTHCRLFTRARVAEALPELVERLLSEARKGSLAHLKVLVELSGLNTGDVVPQGRRKGKSLEAILKERWAQDRKELGPKQRGENEMEATAGDRRMDEG